MKGLIFSVEEFAVHDGDGLRSSVFFKGCPLRCQWCHNPEGLLPEPQRVKNPNGCLRCGRCEQVCPSPEHCAACGRCAAFCPRGLIRISGEYWEPEALAERVKRNFPDPAACGVTVSGGEPLMQPQFLCALLDALKPLNRAIETSGFAEETVFLEALKRLDFVFLDVKHMDDERHRYYTGVGNGPIQRNLDLLMESGLPFVVRVPVISGVNDSDENFNALGARLRGAARLRHVELLPYNSMAGAKYPMLGWRYEPEFHAPGAARREELADILERYGVRVQWRKANGGERQ